MGPMGPVGAMGPMGQPGVAGPPVGIKREQSDTLF